MNPELEQLAQRVVGALLTGLYQGLLLTLVFWAGLKIFRGTNATTRHAVGFVALLAVTLLPWLHFLMPEGAHQRVASNANDRVTEQAGAQYVLPNPMNARDVRTPEMASPDDDDIGPGAFRAVPTPVFATQSAIGETVVEEMPGPSATMAATTAREVGVESAGRVKPDADPASIDESRAESSRTSTGQAPFTLPAARKWQAEVPGIASVIALAVLGVIATMRLLRLGWQWVVLLRLKRCAALPGSDLAEMFSALQHELRITRPVRLLVDGRITTPMAVGYFRPAVLLPAGLAAGPMERGIEGILRHELAHIQRRDDWSNLLQQIIAAIHFYHPAVAWLSHRLTMEREVACDDFALAQSGSRRDYALLLAEFAGRNRGREWIAAPAAWSSRSQLKERINMILDPHRNTSRRLARTSAGVLTVATLATAGLALIAGPRLVLAASDDMALTPPTAGTAGSALVSPAGDALIAHAGDAPPPAVTISASADVEWNADHNVSHAIAIRRGPDVVISARPAIKVVPGATIAVAGSPGIIVAQAPPPEPAQPADVRPPKAPKPARAPRALSVPAAEHPLPPAKPDESIEQRMERLERMIEQLVGDRKFHFELKPGKEMELKGFEWHNRVPAPGEPFAWNVPHPDQHWPMDEEQRKVVEKSVKAAGKQMERAMQEVQREVARATEETARVQRDVQLRAQLEVKKEPGRTSKEADIHRKALEDQRRSIERELENLERQRERLEQQIERLDDRMEQLEEQADESDDREETDAQPRVKEKAGKP